MSIPTVDGKYCCSYCRRIFEKENDAKKHESYSCLFKRVLFELHSSEGDILDLGNNGHLNSDVFKDLKNKIHEAYICLNDNTTISLVNKGLL